MGEIENLDELVNSHYNVVVENNKEIKSVIEECTSTISSNVDNKEITSDNSPYNLTLRREEFSDDKQIKKFIKSVEAIVRGIPEYRDLTTYIKETLGHYAWALTKELSSQVHVDIHHHPVSLYSIVKAHIFKKLEDNQEFCSLDIAQEVIEMHYENRVGYIPLVRTLHEKFHAGFLSLPIDIVHGDYRYFIQNYSVYLEEDDLDTINSRLAVNRTNCGWGNNYSWSTGNYQSEKE